MLPLMCKTCLFGCSWAWQLCFILSSFFLQHTHTDCLAPSLPICLTLTLQLWCLIRVIFNLPSAETSCTAMPLFSRIAMHTGGEKKQMMKTFYMIKIVCARSDRALVLFLEARGLVGWRARRPSVFPSRSSLLFLCSQVSLPATCSITPPQWATMQLHD